MSKKQQRKSEPSLALALVAIATPLFAAGVAPSFAQSTVDRNETAVHQSGFMGTSLFDSVQFILHRSTMHRAAPVRSSSVQSSAASSVSSLPPCSPTAVQSSAPSSAAVQLRMIDLTESQRQTLRSQLRNNACPQTAEAAYLDLCHRMLNERPARETRAGLLNPHQ